MAGAVQHGASTLPAEYFGHFPEHDGAEIHLATEFQNMVYDHPALPLPLKREIERWVFEKYGDQRKAGETENQFLYKNRKQAIGHFKEESLEPPGGNAWSDRSVAPEEVQVPVREASRRRHPGARRPICPAGRRVLT